MLKLLLYYYFNKLRCIITPRRRYGVTGGSVGIPGIPE